MVAERWQRVGLAAVVVIGWALSLAQPASGQQKGQTKSANADRDRAGKAGLLPSELNTIEVVGAWADRVVNVSSVRVTRDFFFDIREIPSGTGTGFLWDSVGHIVTNFHVVDKANRLLVTMKDGTTLAAKRVGGEPRKDIAVLKVNLPKNMKVEAIRLANSTLIRVGQKAIAIGSPFGLDQTVTQGIVSAMGRTVPGYGNVTIRDMIQTDASINPGNSGGPLLDSRGQLVGMNTAIFSQSGASAGIGFAVPSNTIERIVGQIIRFGRVRQPGLGITTFNDAVAERLGIEGVIIQNVAPGGPAEKAGLRGTERTRAGELILGDVIVRIAKERITSFDDLYNVLDKRRIGEIVEVTIRRGQKLKRARLRLVDLEKIR